MAEDEIEEASKLPPDARLESLDERLDRAQRREAAKAAKAQGDPSYRAGQLVLSHLVGGPLGGGVVGWLLDRWWGTKPWAMLILLFLGFAGGIFNVFRISSKQAGSDRHEQG
jgi:ATP synthase protein I